MTVAVNVEVSGAREIAAALASGAARTQELMRLVVEKSAADLQSETQLRASGRPGPNVITGDYRGSWRVENRGDGQVVSRNVGTDRVQANRLEYGFVGPDALGRVYDQPPFPHHGPAVDVIEPRFREAMARVAEQATRW